MSQSLAEKPREIRRAPLFQPAVPAKFARYLALESEVAGMLSDPDLLEFVRYLRDEHPEIADCLIPAWRLTP